MGPLAWHRGDAVVASPVRIATSKAKMPQDSLPALGISTWLGDW